MKKYHLFFSLMCAVTISVFGQTAKTVSKDSVQIIKLENEWARAMVRKDEKVFQRLLAADFFYTENDKMYTRAEIIAALMSPAETIQNAYNEGMQTHIKGNTIIVTGWLIVVGKGTDGTYNRKYRYTDIWFNQDGNWQLVGAHDYLME